jgi:hypothetical protein
MTSVYVTRCRLVERKVDEVEPANKIFVQENARAPLPSQVKLAARETVAEANVKIRNAGQPAKPAVARAAVAG